MNTLLLNSGSTEFSLNKTNNEIIVSTSKKREVIDSEIVSELRDNGLLGYILTSMSNLSNTSLIELIDNLEGDYISTIDDFLANEKEVPDTLKNLNDFSHKYKIKKPTDEIDLKKLNLIFDDMSFSSIYRAVHDKSYSTSKSLTKKIELMDFILENTHDTKYHRIINSSL